MVAPFAAFGEGGVVGLQAVDGTVVGHADEQGATESGVGETGDGLDGGVLGNAPFALCVDVPAQRGFVFQVEGLAVGSEQVADRAGSLSGDGRTFLHVGGEHIDECGLQLAVVEIAEDQFVVAVEA